VTGRFLLCPNHGEFTMAPVVMELTTGWVIQFPTETHKAMWETCRYIDQLAWSPGLRR